MNVTQLKKLVYKYAVDSNALVSQSFLDYIQATNIEKHYGKKMLKILQLNWEYRICRKKSLDIDLSKLKMPEYDIEKRNYEEIIQKIQNSDIVSFDIFDTLIFRAVEKPKDVFRLLEASNCIFDFARHREDAERKAREKDVEATIFDIYEILENEIGLDRNLGIDMELKTEKEICYANPYIKKIYETTKKCGKTIIAVSDMYLPKKFLNEILKKCGYDYFDDIYVSCDMKLSKGSGKLQAEIKKKLGKEKRYVHIGDNLEADIKQSKKNRWDAIYYKNINDIGRKYRRKEMQTLAASVYKGLVNSTLHCGTYQENEFYEYGYVYGGIMAVGYCQYLKKLKEEKNIDQFLFVARDGYILHKIYEQYDKEIDSKYVPFSRFASYQITMERNWKSFFKHVVLPRVEAVPSETLEKVINICDMKCIYPYLEKYGLSKDDIFNYSIYDKVKTIFSENIQQINIEYQNSVKAAEKYFCNIIGEHKHICIVDVGWQGTGAICLKYFLEEKCGMDISVCGTLMGTSNSDSTDIHISKEELFSYMFSKQNNIEMLQRHMAKHNDYEFRKLLVEILFTENAPSFIKYELDDDGEIEFVYGLVENNANIIASIQKGILDFTTQYFIYEKKFGKILTICGQEAYVPIDSLAKNKKYCVELLGNYEINENSGIFEKMNPRTFKEIL